MLFERFTEGAIKTIILAQEESRRLGHNFVGTEQILLGVIREGIGIGARALTAKGVNIKDARVEVEKIINRGSGFVAVEIPFTPRSKRVLELSWGEARALGHNYIGTEHLLLGLIQEGEGVAARVLKTFGVDLNELRQDVIRQIAERSSPEPNLQSSTGSMINPDTPWRICPNCAETIKKAAHVCYFCDYGVSDEHFVECKFCKERVRKEAVICKFCRSSLTDQALPSDTLDVE